MDKANIKMDEYLAEQLEREDERKEEEEVVQRQERMKMEEWIQRSVVVRKRRTPGPNRCGR